MDVKTQSLGAASPAATSTRRSETWGGFVLFLIKLVAAVLAFRILLFSPFSIPSESMLPQLMNGDYLLAAKWPYGISRHSLPIDVPLPEGRLLASAPARGDIVIFKHPVDGTEYIKRVIGLPGDRVAVVAGQVVLNGVAVPRRRVEDVMVPMSANTACASGAIERQPDGREACRYTAFRETLPGGPSFTVLDFGLVPGADRFDEITVPPGTMFVLGDNRDASLDSRFEAAAGFGVGLVPQDLLVGRAAVIVWSTDGAARWGNPVSWITATRWDRIGDLL